MIKRVHTFLRAFVEDRDNCIAGLADDLVKDVIFCSIKPSQNVIRNGKCLGTSDADAEPRKIPLAKRIDQGS